VSAAARVARTHGAPHDALAEMLHIAAAAMRCVDDARHAGQSLLRDRVAKYAAAPVLRAMKARQQSAIRVIMMPMMPPYAASR